MHGAPFLAAGLPFWSANNLPSWWGNLFFHQRTQRTGPFVGKRSRRRAGCLHLREWTVVLAGHGWKQCLRVGRAILYRNLHKKARNLRSRGQCCRQKVPWMWLRECRGWCPGVTNEISLISDWAFLGKIKFDCWMGGGIYVFIEEWRGLIDVSSKCDWMVAQGWIFDCVRRWPGVISF